MVFLFVLFHFIQFIGQFNKEGSSVRRFGSIAQSHRGRKRKWVEGKIQIAAQSSNAIRFTIILAPSKTLIQSQRLIMYPAPNPIYNAFLCTRLL